MIEIRAISLDHSQVKDYIRKFCRDKCIDSTSGVILFEHEFSITLEVFYFEKDKTKYAMIESAKATHLRTNKPVKVIFRNERILI